MTQETSCFSCGEALAKPDAVICIQCGANQKTQTTFAAPEPSSSPPKSSTLPIIAIVVLCLAGVTAFVVTRGGDDPPPSPPGVPSATPPSTPQTRLEPPAPKIEATTLATYPKPVSKRVESVILSRDLATVTCVLDDGTATSILANGEEIVPPQKGHLRLLQDESATKVIPVFQDRDSNSFRVFYDGQISPAIEDFLLGDSLVAYNADMSTVAYVGTIDEAYYLWKNGKRSTLSAQPLGMHVFSDGRVIVETIDGWITEAGDEIGVDREIREHTGVIVMSTRDGRFVSFAREGHALPGRYLKYRELTTRGPDNTVVFIGQAADDRERLVIGQRALPWHYRVKEFLLNSDATHVIARVQPDQFKPNEIYLDGEPLRIPPPVLDVGFHGVRSKVWNSDDQLQLTYSTRSGVFVSIGEYLCSRPFSDAGRNLNRHGPPPAFFVGDSRDGGYLFYKGKEYGPDPIWYKTSPVTGQVAFVVKSPSDYIV